MQHRGGAHLVQRVRVRREVRVRLDQATQLVLDGVVLRVRHRGRAPVVGVAHDDDPIGEFLDAFPSVHAPDVTGDHRQKGRPGSCRATTCGHCRGRGGRARPAPRGSPASARKRPPAQLRAEPGGGHPGDDGDELGGGDGGQGHGQSGHDERDAPGGAVRLQDVVDAVTTAAAAETTTWGSAVNPAVVAGSTARSWRPAVTRVSVRTVAERTSAGCVVSSVSRTSTVPRRSPSASVSASPSTRRQTPGAVAATRAIRRGPARPPRRRCTAA